jgi:hypothetical protein
MVEPGGQAAGPARAADIEVQTGLECETPQRTDDRVNTAGQFQAQYIGPGIRGNVCYWRHGFEQAGAGR